ADEKVDANRVSALARHCGSSATPVRIAFALQPSFVLAFFPAALSFVAAQRLAVVVGRSAVANASTLESRMAAMPLTSPVVAQPPCISRVAKRLVSFVCALETHAGSTATPCRAPLA